MNPIFGEIGGEDAEAQLDDQRGDIADGEDRTEVVAEFAPVHKPLAHRSELKIKHFGGDFIKTDDTGDGDEVARFEHE